MPAIEPSDQRMTDDLGKTMLRRQPWIIIIIILICYRVINRTNKIQ